MHLSKDNFRVSISTACIKLSWESVGSCGQARPQVRKENSDLLLRKASFIGLLLSIFSKVIYTLNILHYEYSQQLIESQFLQHAFELAEQAQKETVTLPSASSAQ
jgi:hypothetical protein